MEKIVVEQFIVGLPPALKISLKGKKGRGVTGCRYLCRGSEVWRIW